MGSIDVIKESTSFLDLFLHLALSNDPDKNYSICYCFAAICFLFIETVVFSEQEFINRWKADL